MRCAICRDVELDPANPTRCCLECRLLAQAGWFDREVWCPIVGFKGWEISDQGRIRHGRSLEIRQPDRSGRYPRVHLNGLRRYVHVLQAETWLGPRPFGALVLHADDCPANVHIGNLAYGDHRDNWADRQRNRKATP
jgi:hypothetical protein